MSPAALRAHLAATVAAVLLLGALAGCGSGSGDADAVPVGPAPRLKAVDAFPNLSFGQITFVTHAGDGSNRLFATQRSGQIFVFANRSDVGSAPVFLDLGSKVDTSTPEAGLSGLTFDPDYRNNGYLYVTYAVLAPTRKVRLSRFKVSADPNVADAASERVLYEYDHANVWHFGGWLGFGPDGMLYVSTGDNIFDPALQDVASPYGKILRLVVAADGTAKAAADNPWGTHAWAMGFRNPWRCSFDRAKGDLWCGDVGEDRREEVNVVRRGAHHGWTFFEGDLPFTPPGGPVAGGLPYSDYAPPIHQYDHTVGASVIGGYVYRGSRHPSLVGRYVYGDLIAAKVWAFTPDANGQLGSVDEVAAAVGPITTFGEDEAGELYAGTANGRIVRFDAE